MTGSTRYCVSRRQQFPWARKDATRMTPELPTGNAHSSFDWPEGLLEGAGVEDGVVNGVRVGDGVLNGVRVGVGVLSVVVGATYRDV